MELHY